MHRSVHRSLVAAMLVVVASTLAACSVDDGVLDTTIYRCTTTPDCGPGSACTTGGVLVGYDFCAPAPPTCSAATCDGGCTADGTCLRGCDLHADGSAGPCPIEGTTCIRVSSQTRGVCYPVQSCDRTADCPGGLCITEALRDGMGRVPTNLYCLPTPTAMMSCPAGYVYIPFFVEGGICAPACSLDFECPPAFGCFTLGRFFGLDQPPCFPGTIGTACTDDTNCIAGHCLQFNESPAAKVCTLTCSEIEAIPGRDCASLSDSDFLTGLRTWECARPQGRDVCAPVYGPGFPCNDAYPCDTSMGLTCQDFDLGMMFGHANFCTKDCTTDDDCGPRGICLPGQNRCFGLLGRGDPCARNRQCSSGMCVALRCT